MFLLKRLFDFSFFLYTSAQHNNRPFHTPTNVNLLLTKVYTNLKTESGNYLF